MHRIRRGCLIAGFLIWIVVGPRHSQAQYTANFQTNIISGVITNPPSPYYLGSTNFADVLLIKNGGVLSVSSVYMGNDVSSSNNIMLITDPGSAWTGNTLYVGYGGMGNGVIITNGGKVVGQCTIGNWNSSNNSVVVTGTGSALSNSGTLLVSPSGQNNHLFINNGGGAWCVGSYVGRGGGVGNPSVLVTDVGSVWSNSGNLSIGFDYTYAASMVVSNGGRVFDNSGTIGDGNVLPDNLSTNNTVVITGPGSIWSNRGNLSVGYANDENTVIINNGGRVINSNATVGCCGNTVVVTDPGSVWLSAGPLDISGTRSSLLVSNGGLVIATASYLSYNSHATVTGTGSIWSNGAGLSLGFDSSSSSGGNSVTIDDGAKLTSDTVTLSAIGNLVQVSGTGSVWNSRGSVLLGDSSDHNTVQILGPASLWTVDGSVSIGGYVGATNSVQISGVGSVWNVLGSIAVGGYRSGNSLMISNATVLATNVTVGGGSGFNSLLQLDNGSLIVTNALGTGSLIYGYGPQAVLLLNGGTILVDRLIASNGNATLIFNSGGISSAGTTLSNLSTFVMGDSTHSATFYMKGGTHVFATGFWIRPNAALAGCGVVFGNGLIEGDLRIDCGGTSAFTGSITNYGRIEVQNGATLSFYQSLVNYGQIIATNGTIWHTSTFENHGTVLGSIQDGFNMWTNTSNGKWEDPLSWSVGTPTALYRCSLANSVNKTVLMDATTASIQPGSLYIIDLSVAAPEGITNTLWINNLGTLTGLNITNALTVSGGGKLVISNSSVTVNQAYGGSVSIDGEASLATASLTASNGPVILGQNGTGKMTASGASVLSRDTWLGLSTNSLGLLTVTGSDSIWRITTNFYLGFAGSGNSLVISNGGRVVDIAGYVGSASSSNNRILVTGTGSIWSNSGTLSLNSPGNSVLVNNGGRVFDVNGSVGSTSNSIVIADLGSVWTNSSGLSLGMSSSPSGNTLVISNGAKVASANCDLGGQTSAFVDGTGSVWSAKTGFTLGTYYGGSNRVVVSNGGKMIGGIYAGPSFSPAGKSMDGNVLVVTGPGSVLSNNGTIELAYHYGSGNSLIITNNGFVVDNTCYIGPDGYDNASSASSNNVRVVAGGIWRNNIVYLGTQGSNNSLVVNGGTVTVTGTITVGNYNGACDNYIELDNGGLFVTNSAQTATLTIHRGKFILNGGLLQVDQLIMDTSCGLFVRNGGTVSVRTLMLDPLMSAVGDGIPNGWKQRYGLDPLDPNFANEDADGDGLSNLQEYRVSTDPTNSASSFRITSITVQGNDVLLTWMLASGKINALQATTGDGSGTDNFTDLFTVTNAVNSVTNYLDVGAVTNVPARYYRVRLVPY